MNSIRSSAELKTAIIHLESQQSAQEQMLKEQFHHVIESLKPVNIIKNTITEALTISGSGRNIIEYIANLAGDFIAKQVKGSNPDNFFRKYFGQFLHYGVSAFITMNSETILSWGHWLIKKLFGDNEKREDE